MLGKKVHAAATQVAGQLELSLMGELRRLGARLQKMDDMIEEQLQSLLGDLGEAATKADVQHALQVAHEDVAAQLEAAESAAQKANAAAARAHRGLQKHEAEAEELVGQSSDIDDGPYPHARHPKLG